MTGLEYLIAVRSAALENGDELFAAKILQEILRVGMNYVPPDDATETRLLDTKEVRQIRRRFDKLQDSRLTTEERAIERRELRRENRRPRNAVQ